jgi:hypothetical protein
VLSKLDLRESWLAGYPFLAFPESWLAGYPVYGLTERVFFLFGEAEFKSHFEKTFFVT